MQTAAGVVDPTVAGAGNSDGSKVVVGFLTAEAPTEFLGVALRAGQLQLGGAAAAAEGTEE